MVGSDLFDVALDLISIYPYVVRMDPLSIVSISVLCNNKFNEKKMMREHALRLVKCLCNHMESLEFRYATIISTETILTAAQSGNHNIVEEIVETFPLAILSTNSSGQNFLHLAVKNRCDKVFNLMYQTSNYKFNYSDKLDKDGNSILHFAARLAPTHKLNLVSGAALQMQRELQWFQEASKFVTAYTRGVANHSGETAEKIFTEEHKELKIEGEKWMKDTANSCTIAAALIATVVFAAAITVPGGNQSESGYPMFYQSSAFKLFAVSDSISLFTSTTSLLMFLSILTSRYAEQDFFSTVYLVFGRKNAWVLIAVGVLASMPISSFVLLQFPLLRDVISSTYGRGIFGKQSDRPFH
ncbi:hypothetical protein SASPL_148396 [Salvia splendens]|uniref:PGG domain-containing protein n=1 Tax=Salvia splendens TaxID=180675 RepID=A0A8X8Z423_SALSN|nr:hypothetical protein SASPL_148396 [Salvia splendens]